MMPTAADEPTAPDGSTAHSVVRSSVLRFTVWSVVALLVLALGAVLIAQHVARQEAFNDARRKALAIGQTIAAPLVDADVRAGKPGAAAQLDTVMRNRMSDGTLTHVKLWSRDGKVIWADDGRLTQRRFELPDDVIELFGTSRAVAEVSRLNRAENVRERTEGELLEVYAGATDADGAPMVFEAYMPTAAMRAGEQSLIHGLLPMSLASLLLFQAAVLPMAVSLARRVDRSRVERARMMRHALLASDLERRRVAQDLHDGVIQDLAGLGYAFPSIGAHLSSPEAGTARETLQTAAEVLRRDVAALRSMLIELYPPELDGDRLATALEELAASTRERGVTVTTGVGADLHLSDDAARLAYRVVREALRNVVKHARATTAVVEVVRVEGRVVVRVTDDGRGVTQGVESTRGHLGLQLLDDTLHDYGGTLRLAGATAGGAVLEASFPMVAPRS